MTNQFTLEVKDAPEIPNEGKPRRSALFPQLVAGFDGVANLHENLLNGVKTAGDLPYLGHRVQLENNNVGPYLWQTYSEVAKRVTNLGAYIMSLNFPINSSIGLFSINRAEWVIGEHACYQYSYVTVPLYDTLGPEAIEYICTQTNIPLIVATADKALIALSIKEKLPTLSHLVIMDTPTEELLNKGKQLNVTIISILDAEKLGEANPVESRPMGSDGIATICYTSGTTGLPKGVLLTHKNMLAAGAAGAALQNNGRMYKITKDDSHISYLPLAHVFERVVQVMLTNAGARCGFYQGDTLKLLDDVAELKPSVFVSVPRLYNRIYDKVLAGVSAKGGVAAFLFNQAFNAKKKGLANGTQKSWLWDKLVFGAVRQRLGGNVKMMITGAAPISAEVIDFLRICFSADLYEGYGQTETAAALSITDSSDLESGHVGAPFPCSEVKLVDVPGMNYTSKDTPNPRGEICVRGHSVFVGYYNLPDKTAETLDADGWCHTGDIGMWDSKGRLRIIDRVKNIFKLAQGEYIAPEKIENVYGRHELVAQSFVYGDSLQATLVGVIVLDEDTMKIYSQKHNLGSKTLKEYTEDPKVLELVSKDLLAHAKGSELKGFEILKKIRLYHEQFSMENGLLTPTFKLKRHEAKILFKNQIDEMYAEINSA
ncbi:Long chain acyl-CoA synthetase 7 peroxisomal [Lobulomyces angularis]|nr:Long chain acyl-CoA synthetase 7 peroxisomal [Lobulomyces angularis]